MARRTLATDNFNRANGALGANWGPNSGQIAPVIVSSGVQVAVDETEMARYIGVGDPSGSIWCQATTINVTAIASTRSLGLLLRLPAVGATWTGYFFRIDATTFNLYRLPAFTLLAGPISGSLADGTFAFEHLADGSLIGYQGATVVITASDSTYLTGGAGLLMNVPTGIAWDDFAMGDFVSSSGPRPGSLSLLGVGR